MRHLVIFAVVQLLVASASATPVENNSSPLPSPSKGKLGDISTERVTSPPYDAIASSSKPPSIADVNGVDPTEHRCCRTPSKHAMQDVPPNRPGQLPQLTKPLGPELLTKSRARRSALNFNLCPPPLAACNYAWVEASKRRGWGKRANSLTNQEEPSASMTFPLGSELRSDIDSVDEQLVEKRRGWGKRDSLDAGAAADTDGDFDAGERQDRWRHLTNNMDV